MMKKFIFILLLMATPVIATPVTIYDKRNTGNPPLIIGAQANYGRNPTITLGTIPPGSTKKFDVPSGTKTMTFDVTQSTDHFYMSYTPGQGYQIECFGKDCSTQYQIKAIK